jgi:hypothetical protein
VNILSIEASDADAVVLHPPLMGEFELAAPADIWILEVLPPPEGGPQPHLAAGPVPMIVVASMTEVPVE